MLIDLYKRWLFEVWGAGQFQVAEQFFAEDLIDNNAVPGQQRGRAGDPWVAQAVRKAFPDLEGSRSTSPSSTTTSSPVAGPCPGPTPAPSIYSASPRPVGQSACLANRRWR